MTASNAREPLSPLHSAALDWAEHGFHIFPVHTDLVNGRKVPLIKGWRDQATTDAAQITAWWTEWPRANIGCVPDRSGCFVVDLDRKDGKDGVAELELLAVCNDPFPNTLTMGTGSGGEHRWLRGRAPNSAGTIARGIDVRGARETPAGLKLGFVVLPPSRFGEGVPYYVSNDAPIAESGWFAELARKRPAGASVTSRAPEGIAPDLPVNVARARAHLRALVRGGDVAIEGQGGDHRTFRLAAEMQDLGLSEEKALELIVEDWNPHCLPPWESAELDAKVANGFAYASNPWGCFASDGRSAEDVFGHLLGNLGLDDTASEPNRSAPDDGWAARVASFRGTEPRQDKGLPDPVFWDEAGSLPKFPDGAVGIAYGPSGAHKTTLLLSILLDVLRRQPDARVAYFAGEGAYGVRRSRIPAASEAAGLGADDLTGRWRTVTRVPTLKDVADERALIEAQHDFRPNIVVIDTLATALPGEDENTAATGSLLTANGPAGRIRAALHAAVIFVAHSGKDQGKGIRGSSAFHGNVDFVWKITADKEAGTITLKVEKMRDGPDGFSLYFRIENASNGAPIAVPMSDAEFRGLHNSPATLTRKDVGAALKRLGQPVSTNILASDLVPVADGEEEDDRQRRILNEEKRLQALARPDKKGRAGVLFGYLELDHRGEPFKPYRWALASYEDGDEE